MRKRAFAYNRIKSLTYVMELLDEVSADVGAGSDELVKSILSGENDGASSAVKKILEDYVGGGGGLSVREFYRRDYGAERLKSMGLTAAIDPVRDTRVVEVALMLSEWENRIPERIIRTELDVIKKIIQIADENKSRGLTAREITLAAEELVRDEFHEAQFHLEALHEDHRRDLIKKALEIKGN